MEDRYIVKCFLHVDVHSTGKSDSPRNTSTEPEGLWMTTPEPMKDTFVGPDMDRARCAELCHDALFIHARKSKENSISERNSLLTVTGIRTNWYGEPFETG